MTADFQVVIPSRPHKPRYDAYNSLLQLGKERLLVVYDYPLSFARNKGIAMAKADVVVQVEDDGKYSAEYIERVASLVAPNRFVVRDPPLVLAGRREDFIALGGFEERLFHVDGCQYAEVTEFMWRILSRGYELVEAPWDERLEHLSVARNPWSIRELIFRINTTLAFIRYKAPVSWREKRMSLRSKLFRFFFMQWYPPSWGSFAHILAFPYWQIRGKIGKRNSFGW